MKILAWLSQNWRYTVAHILLLLVSALGLFACTNSGALRIDRIPSLPAPLSPLPAATIVAPAGASDVTVTRKAALDASSLLRPQAALEMMFGGEALANDENAALLKVSQEGFTTTLQLNLMACYWEDQLEKCLVLVDGASDNCHACQAVISGAVFYRSEGAWQIAVSHPNLLERGSMGYVPKAELIQIGPGKYGALLRSGWTGQGYTGERVTIFAEVAGDFRVVFEILASERQDYVLAPGLNWGYSSQLEFIETEHSPYDTLVVTQFGVNRAGDRFKTVTGYAFTGEEYVPIDPSD